MTASAPIAEHRTDASAPSIGHRIDAGYASLSRQEQRAGGALAEARRRGCALVQLTTDRARPDAHRFYERLGFVASHVGYKLVLDGT